jgi:hypothetical protein
MTYRQSRILMTSACSEGLALHHALSALCSVRPAGMVTTHPNSIHKGYLTKMPKPEHAHAYMAPTEQLLVLFRTVTVPCI